MTGTFSVNNHPVVVLFDPGASHTFISKECASRLGLEVESMSRSCHINSPGGTISYKSYCQASSSKVAREDFSYVPYNSSDSKGGYYFGHELDGRSGRSFGHSFTICAHQIFSSWFYDSTSYGPWIIDPCGESG